VQEAAQWYEAQDRGLGREFERSQVAALTEEVQEITGEVWSWPAWTRATRVSRPPKLPPSTGVSLTCQALGSECGASSCCRCAGRSPVIEYASAMEEERSEASRAVDVLLPGGLLLARGFTMPVCPPWVPVPMGASARRSWSV
jgi:hypothetical protein